MIEYHAHRNQQNPHWCLDEILNTATATSADVLLLSDLRTHADLKYFRQKSDRELTLVRVDASDEAKMMRGWVPDPNKDKMHTEVELDDFNGWTMCVDNSDNTDLGASMLNQWLNMTAVPRILA